MPIYSELKSVDKMANVTIDRPEVCCDLNRFAVVWTSKSPCGGEVVVQFIATRACDVVWMPVTYHDICSNKFYKQRNVLPLIFFESRTGLPREEKDLVPLNPISALY